jgi:hypothetical protein
VSWCGAQNHGMGGSQASKELVVCGVDIGNSVEQLVAERAAIPPPVGLCRSFPFFFRSGSMAAAGGGGAGVTRGLARQMGTIDRAATQDEFVDAKKVINDYIKANKKAAPKIVAMIRRNAFADNVQTQALRRLPKTWKRFKNVKQPVAGQALAFTSHDQGDLDNLSNVDASRMLAISTNQNMEERILDHLLVVDSFFQDQRLKWGVQPQQTKDLVNSMTVPNIVWENEGWYRLAGNQITNRARAAPNNTFNIQGAIGANVSITENWDYANSTITWRDANGGDVKIKHSSKF